MRVVDNLDTGAGVTKIDGILTQASGGEFCNWLSIAPERRIGKLAFSPAGNELLYDDIARADLAARSGKSSFQRLPVIGADNLRTGNRGVAPAHIRLQDNGKCHVQRIGVIGRGHCIGPGEADTEFRRAFVEQRFLAQPLKGRPIRQDDFVKGGKLVAML